MKKKEYKAGDETILELVDKDGFIVLQTPNEPNQAVSIPKGLLSFLAKDFVEIEAAYTKGIEEQHQKMEQALRG